MNGLRFMTWGALLKSLALLLVAGGTASVLAVEPSMSEKKKTPMAPAIEKALADFTDKGVPIKKKQLTEHMQDLIKEMDDSVHLSADETKALTVAADKAVDEAIAAWKPKFVEALRPYLFGNTAERAVARVPGWKLETVAANEPVEDWAMPEDRPSWAGAVNLGLGAERAGKWSKVVAEKSAARDKEIAAYLKDWAEKSCQPLEKDIRAQIDEIKRELKPSEAQVEALDKAVKKAIEDVNARETARGTAILRGMTEKTRKSVMGRKSYYLKFDAPTKAEDAAEWSNWLKQTLPKEQIEAWQKAKVDKKENAAKELAKTLKPVRDETRDNMLDTLKFEAANIAEAAGVPEERAKQLKDAVPAVVDAYMVEWDKTMKERLASMSEQQRSLFAARRMMISTNLPGEGDPKQLPEWKKQVETILTAEEKLRWKELVETQQTLTVRSFVRISLAEMDKRVFLTEEQREKLEPLMEKPMKSFLESRGFRSNQEYNFSVTELISVMTGAGGTVAKPVLQPAQWDHWKDVSKNLGEDGNSRRMMFRGGLQKVAVEPAKPAPAKIGVKRVEPPSVETIVSEYLHKMEERQKTSDLKAMQLHVEEASRIGGLSPEAMAKLTTAAKGAVEMTMVTWRSNMDNWVRSQLMDATPANARPRLENMGSVYFGNQSAGPQDTPVWKSTVEDVLPEDKRKAWKQEQQARQDYRDKAVTSAVILQFQKRCPVTQKQQEQIESLVKVVVKDYGPDIQNWLSEPWFLSSYYCLIPLAGVPEKKLAEVLKPEQMKRVKENALPQAEQYWEGIKQQHDQRLRSGNRNIIFSD